MPVEMKNVGNLGYVLLDNPPVNAIGKDIRQGLLDAVEWAEARKLEGVIVTGAGIAFAAGADAKEFDYAPEEPHFPDVLHRIANSFVPWVAAINGVALGGGAEIALACRYRIARENALIGFPEVILGVVPGAGGTQRLPRIIGTEKAIELISSGKSISGKQAKELGLIHETDDDPISFAEMARQEWLNIAVPSDELNADAVMPETLEKYRAIAAKKMRGQSAPLQAIDLVNLASQKTLLEGMAEERKIFLKLRHCDEAKALRHIFFAERGAKAPKSLKKIDTPMVESVVVVGGGTMGASIAYAFLNKNISVTILEINDEAMARAKNNVEEIIIASLKRNLVNQEKCDRMRANFKIETDYSKLNAVDIVVEAGFESLDVKKEIFGKLQANLPENVIFATNTSYLDIDEIADSLDNSSRLIGLHFFAPAHIMKLLEIVRGANSSDDALALGFSVAKKIAKIPVLASVCDGFIGNRILMRYREVADILLMDGALPWQIDEAMVEFGYPMGPYEAQDLSGLDIAYANRRRQDAMRDPKRRYIPIADRLVEKGRLGRKASAGWYCYPESKTKVIDPIIEELIIAESGLAHIERRAFTADEIRHRLLLAMINEASQILHEGIAQKASDIDIVTVHGYGFPRWRGGLMHFADSLGANKILSDLQLLAKEDALLWQASPVIVSCAQSNIAIADWHRGV